MQSDANWNQPMIWMGLLWLVMFFGSIALVWVLIVRMPVDYFTHEDRPLGKLQQQHPVIRMLLVILKNVCGLALVVTGMIMLVTPGQGLLFILLGLSLLDFPGKRKIIRRALGRPRVVNTINQIRAKAKRAPIQVPV